MTTIFLADVYAAAADSRDTTSYTPPTRPRRTYRALFACLECGRKFATVAAARRAVDHGCPKCGGTDIDLA